MTNNEIKSVLRIVSTLETTKGDMSGGSALWNTSWKNEDDP